MEGGWGWKRTSIGRVGSGRWLDPDVIQTSIGRVGSEHRLEGGWTRTSIGRIGRVGPGRRLEGLEGTSMGELNGMSIESGRQIGRDAGLEGKSDLDVVA